MARGFYKACFRGELAKGFCLGNQIDYSDLSRHAELTSVNAKLLRFYLGIADSPRVGFVGQSQHSRLPVNVEAKNVLRSSLLIR